eukprot:SAG31_NODE_988_length_10542_cov_52.848319_3_plen_103_part_00
MHHCAKEVSGRVGRAAVQDGTSPAKLLEPITILNLELNIGNGKEFSGEETVSQTEADQTHLKKSAHRRQKIEDPRQETRKRKPVKHIVLQHGVEPTPQTVPA